MPLSTLLGGLFGGGAKHAGNIMPAVPGLGSGPAAAATPPFLPAPAAAPAAAAPANATAQYTNPNAVLGAIAAGGQQPSTFQSVIQTLLGGTPPLRQPGAPAPAGLGELDRAITDDRTVSPTETEIGEPD